MVTHIPAINDLTVSVLGTGAVLIFLRNFGKRIVGNDSFGIVMFGSLIGLNVTGLYFSFFAAEVFSVTQLAIAYDDSINKTLRML